MSPTAALLGALLASSWQVTAVAAAFALARLGIRSPRVRYALALGALGAQAAWPAWTFTQLLRLHLGLGSPSTAATSGRWDWLALLWAVGAVAMLVRTAGGLVVLQRQLARAEEPEAPALERLEALRARLGVRRVRWAVSRLLEVPLTAGFLRPVVLLPASLLTAVPGEDLALLAAHELMHVRRWDYLVNLLQSVVEALLFFHPAAWWVSASARAEREFCCDDAVVAALGAARPYARALLNLEQSRAPHPLAVPLVVPATGGPLMHRIRRLLDTRRASAPSLLAAPVVALALAIATLGSCAARNLAGEPPLAVAPPELVPALKTLCADLGADAARPELARVDPQDLLTIVLADLGEANPRLEAFMAEVSRAPVPQRRETFRRSVGAALGSPWQCPAFEALWDGTPVWPAGSGAAQ